MIRSRHATTLWVFVIWSSFLATASVAAGGELTFVDDLRTWQDSSKSHAVNAALVSYESRHLTLKTSAGRTICISIDEVSKPDQVYAIRKIQSARAELSKSLRPKRDATNVHDDKIVPPASPTLNRSVSTVAAERLYGVHWTPLDQAETLAAKGNKPIMWLRVLGDMKGFM